MLAHHTLITISSSSPSQAERDADRGQPPAGGVDCHGSAIERVPSNGQRPGWGNAGFDIEFILHTSERVLYLRANSEDTFRLWIAGIVAAGGRAPLQAGPKSKGGHVGLSKSGKIVVPAISKDRSLSSALDFGMDTSSLGLMSQRLPTLSLPANLAEVPTLDLTLGEDPEMPPAHASCQKWRITRTAHLCISGHPLPCPGSHSPTRYQ